MPARCWDWPNVVCAAPRPTTRIPCRRAKRSIRRDVLDRAGTQHGDRLLADDLAEVLGVGAAGGVVDQQRAVEAGDLVDVQPARRPAAAAVTHRPTPPWKPTTASPATALVNERRERAESDDMQVRFHTRAGGSSWRSADLLVEKHAGVLCDAPDQPVVFGCHTEPAIAALTVTTIAAALPTTCW